MALGTIVIADVVPAGQKAVERDYFLYYFSEPTFIPTADRVLPETRAKLIELVGDSLPYKAKIYIVNDIEQFNKLIRGKFPDWGAAAAFSERELIAVKSPNRFNLNKSLGELLAHEYTHLVIDYKSGFHQPPRWFHEGLAMYVSMEWSWSDNLAMGKTAVFGQFLRLSAIEHVNRFNESKAHVAYAQSYQAVQFMIKSYGKKSVGIFLSGLASGKDVDEALFQATGSNLLEFETDLKADLNKRFNITSLFMDTIFLWIGLAIIVIIGAIMKYNKRRSYYKKWAEEEKLHSTDFDYGDSDNPEHIDDEDEPWRG